MHCLTTTRIAARTVATLLVAATFLTVPAGKPVLAQTAPAGPASAETTLAETTLAETTLADRARAILARNCVSCHGGEGERTLAAAAAGFDTVADLDSLGRDSRRVRPGDPENSVLYRMIAANQMPPGAAGNPAGQLSAAEKAVIRDWIQALAPPGRPAPGLFVSDDRIRRYIQADQDRLGARSAGARYFSFAHLHNAGDSGAQLEMYRQGLAKLLNSLSWQPRVIRPVPVDAGGLVVRVLLDELGWSPGQWERVVNFNMNEVVVRNVTLSVEKAFNLEDIYDEDASDYLGGRRARTTIAGPDGQGDALNYVKADWFAFAASRPPLYHDLLDLPDRLDALERRLDVDRRGNIRNRRVARVAIQNSRVGLNNRMIERHDARYGAYWISYDFAEDNEERSRDLFQSPLGPYGFGKYIFIEDGGEVIFHLPNGFQGYLLTNDEGIRIDAGPLNIVQDRTRPEDSTILNGASCMACHANGMNLATDEVRGHVEESGLFPPEVVEEVRALYPPGEVMDSLFQRDNTVFQEAQRRAGIDPGLRDSQNREQVAALIARFREPLTPVKAAAEFGLEPAAFMAEVEREESFRDLRTRLTRVGLPRERFTLFYNAIALAVSDAPRPAPALAARGQALAPVRAGANPDPARPPLVRAGTGSGTGSGQLAAPAAAAGVAAALQAWQAGDVAAARNQLAVLAEAGDALAQHNLGTLYAIGKDAAPDYGRAVAWYRRAADQGLVDSQYALGLLYSEGYVLSADSDVMARRWFSRAARQGHGPAREKLDALGGAALLPAQGENGDYGAAPALQPGVNGAGALAPLSPGSNGTAAAPALQPGVNGVGALAPLSPGGNGTAAAPALQPGVNGAGVLAPLSPGGNGTAAAPALQPGVNGAGALAPLPPGGNGTAAAPALQPGGNGTGALAPLPPGGNGNRPEYAGTAPATALQPGVRPALEPASARIEPVPPTGGDRLAPGGGWRIQLAALGNRNDAERAWGLFRQQHPDTLTGLRLYLETVDRAGGTLYRVQAGPLATGDDARRLCGTLVGRQQDCLVVKP